MTVEADTVPRPHPRRWFHLMRRAHARAPLRVRLVVATLLLVVVALTGSGIAAITVLRAYLVGRVDSQLRSAAASSGSAVAHGDYQAAVGQGPAPEHDHHALPSAYVLEVLSRSGSRVYGPSHELIDEHEPLPDLPTVTSAQSATAGVRLTTVQAVSGGESWRVVIAPVTLSDGSAGTLLVAQSLGDVNGTINKLIVVMLVIGAIAVVLVAGVGYFVIRASLRPLRDVERTAAAIAAGDLTRRVPRRDERTEVGSLASSLNTMLTEIEEAFAARAASEQEARKSENRMRQFVADASHELRTPLTTIRGFAELYRQRGGAAEADFLHFMERIESEAARMGVLVDDLLLLARLDQQRPLRTDLVDMLAVASDTTVGARAAAPGRRISLEVTNADPPPVVVGDEARLRQVLANLINNAVQHTPSESAVSVQVGSLQQSDGGWLVRVVVADDGPGIPAEQAAHVFERFYRADSARSREDGGTGLGLAIVAALVAGHGGSVRLETSPGVGARFIVELQLANPVVASDVITTDSTNA